MDRALARRVAAWRKVLDMRMWRWLPANPHERGRPVVATQDPARAARNNAQRLRHALRRAAMDPDERRAEYREYQAKRRARLRAERVQP